MYKIAIDEQSETAIFRKNILGFQLQKADLGKFVIREFHTGLYLNQGGFLTPELENANRFESCAAALEEATRLKLPAAELVSMRNLGA